MCSSSVHNAADASAPSLHSHSGKFCTTCSSTSSLPMLPYYKQHSGVDSLAAAAAVGGVPSGGRHRRKRKDWRQKCVSYSRLGGWYVLGAEILGTIILIALCVVAAEQVRAERCARQAGVRACCMQVDHTQKAAARAHVADCQRAWSSLHRQHKCMRPV